LDTPSY